ncbi:MAG: hypothetical protein WC067_03325 [Candidatus Methanomethylophilaceae archaeon]
MNGKIYVIQVVSSGPTGFPDDEVVQIGITAVDMAHSDVESAYLSTILSDPDGLSEEKKDYIHACSSLSDDDLRRGVPLDEVCKEVKSLLFGSDVTSFNISNTFTKYLINEPWDLTHEVTIMPSVESRLPSDIYSIDASKEKRSIIDAYDRIFPDDPNGIGNAETALDLAIRTSYILLFLRSHGRY